MSREPDCVVETLIISSEDGYCAALLVDGKIEKQTEWFADRDIALMFCNLMNDEARRAMTREPDIVQRLRSLNDGNRWPMMDEAAAEIERLHERIASLQASSGYEASIAQLEIERLRLRVKFLEDELKCPSALEPKL